MTEEVETIIHPLTRTPVKGRMLKAGEKIKEGDLVRFPKKGKSGDFRLILKEVPPYGARKLRNLRGS